MNRAVEVTPLSSLEPPPENFKSFVAVLSNALWRNRNHPNSKYMLLGPATLSVIKVSNGGNDETTIRHAHIGGEEFNLVGCYLGAKSQIIFHFRPVDAATYSIMDMSETTIVQHFGDSIAIYIDSVTTPEFKAEMRLAKEAALDAVRLKKSKKVGKNYENSDLGWGEW